MSSILEFSEKILVNKFTSPGTKEDTSEPLNRRGIAVLPLFRTVLGFQQKMTLLLY